jgi:protein TonB
MTTLTAIPEPEVETLVEVRLPAPRIIRPPQSGTPLFTDVLLESSGFQRRRRGFAAIISFTFQCLLLALALIVPLMFTEALPRQQLLAFLVAPTPPPPPPPPAAPAAEKVIHQVQSDLIATGQLRTPTRIPQTVQLIREDDAPPPMASSGGVIGGVPGGIPGGQVGGVIGGIISSTSSLVGLPKPPMPTAPRVRISQGVTKGLLLAKIEPKYPPLARAARIQGDVILNAIISKTGNVENLTLVSGHPMLVPAAFDAVRQWRYRPYLLDGEPVEVETTVTLTFVIIQ